MKSFKNIRERVGKMRSWRQGWDPAEEDQLRKDKKLKKDLEKYMKKDPNRNWTVKQAAKEVPYLLKHMNTNFGNGKGGDLSDKGGKGHQFHNAILNFYDYEYLYEGINEATGREITLDWDFGDPEEYAPDWQDQGVYLDNWDKRKMEIEISGTEKDLLKWLTDDYGMDKKEAQNVIRKGKRIKI